MRKIHITLTDENYEYIREVAYHGRVSKSCVIDVIIGEDLARKPEAIDATETPLKDKPA